MTPQVLLPTLGERLAKARRIADLSQEQVASALKISRRSISRYEVDDSEPSLDVLRRWATLCGVPFSWLATGELPPTPDTGGVIHRYDDSDAAHQGRRRAA